MAWKPTTMLSPTPFNLGGDMFPRKSRLESRMNQTDRKPNNQDVISQNRSTAFALVMASCGRKYVFTSKPCTVVAKPATAPEVN